MIFSDGSVDTLKRRSWDKSMLSSQLEEEEPESVPIPKEASPPPARTLSPVIQVVPPNSAPEIPVHAFQKLESDMPDKKEDEKEKMKEGSRLTRKFKQFRRGEYCKSLQTCKKYTAI